MVQTVVDRGLASFRVVSLGRDEENKVQTNTRPHKPFACALHISAHSPHSNRVPSPCPDELIDDPSMLYESISLRFGSQLGLKTSPRGLWPLNLGLELATKQVVQLSFRFMQ